MAIRLDKAFGGGAETWFCLQVVFDLAQAMKRASRIKVRRVPREAFAAPAAFAPDPAYIPHHHAIHVLFSARGKPERRGGPPILK